MSVRDSTKVLAEPDEKNPAENRETIYRHGAIVKLVDVLCCGVSYSCLVRSSLSSSIIVDC